MSNGQRPQVTDPPPAAVAADLARLAAHLDDQIPPKILDRNLLVATWNIRGFGRVTHKWQAAAGDSPKRDLHAIHVIAEIISRFDVLALQELKGDLEALRLTLDLLGPDWGMILSDVTQGARGNTERIGFLFDTRRVHMSGLACEIVLPDEYLNDAERGLLERQFARTPYAVGFRSLRSRFTLVSVHIVWGDSDTERIAELQAIADWMHAWATDKNAWDRNLIVLGDFNIVGRQGPFTEAFTSTGLQVPEPLRDLPRMIQGVGEPGEERMYDQIAWFAGGRRGPKLDLDFARGGTYDFSKIAMRDLGLAPTPLSWKISDHLPMWVEFEMEP